MTSWRPRAILAACLLLGCTSIAAAEDRHAGHMDHGQHRDQERQGAAAGQPNEAGQSAFAAIAEIVAILDADPETDWSKVDIRALREHLIDMNALTLQASVTEEVLADGLAMTITGEGRTRDAIQRMVPAHAAELDVMDDWSASAETTAEGARLVVTSSDPAMQVKIRRLGFFGLMATGAHHQPHHLAIARGEPMHGHH